MHTCPNPSCRKTFTKPLKALNLQQDSTEPYNACPYCLTKLKEERIIIDSKAEEAPENGENKAAPRNTRPEDEKPASCRHHLGYLSERTEKGQISDECLVCKDIVECMLKKMHE